MVRVFRLDKAEQRSALKSLSLEKQKLFSVVSELKIGSHDLKESSSEQVRGLGCHHGVTHMACIPLTEHWKEKRDSRSQHAIFFSSLILALSDLSSKNESKSVIFSVNTVPGQDRL